MKSIVRACAVGVLLASAMPVMAQGSAKSASLELAKKADKLKPGEWLLYPEIAPDGPTLVYVDIGRQRATIYRNGVRIGVSTISSGKAGNSTPTGVFTILQKNKDHRSSTYDNAPMPYMQRLTWKGVALHAGNLPGYPASHGCVRLPLEFAKRLFTVTEMGGTVVIAGGHEDPVNRPVAGVLAPTLAGVNAGTVDPADAQAARSPGTRRARRTARSRSSSRPATSRSWCSATASSSAAPMRSSLSRSSEAQVMTLAGGVNPHWIQVGVGDLTGEPAEIISTERVEQMRLPHEFVTKMRAAMKPGTTVLVTQASVSQDTTGREQTVMDTSD